MSERECFREGTYGVAVSAGDLRCGDRGSVIVPRVVVHLALDHACPKPRKSVRQRCLPPLLLRERIAAYRSRSGSAICGSQAGRSFRPGRRRSRRCAPGPRRHRRRSCGCGPRPRPSTDRCIRHAPRQHTTSGQDKLGLSRGRCGTHWPWEARLDLPGASSSFIFWRQSGQEGASSLPFSQ